MGAPGPPSLRVADRAAPPRGGRSNEPSFVRLHGVAIHQDFEGKGWALSDQDFDVSLGLVKEIGANTVRLAHYPYPKYVLDRLFRSIAVGFIR